MQFMRGFKTVTKQVKKSHHGAVRRRALINIGVRAIFFARGGGKLFAQKTLASCPNFYKTVEQKRGPYDATT